MKPMPWFAKRPLGLRVAAHRARPRRQRSGRPRLPATRRTGGQRTRPSPPDGFLEAAGWSCVPLHPAAGDRSTRRRTAPAPRLSPALPFRCSAQPPRGLPFPEFVCEKEKVPGPCSGTESSLRVSVLDLNLLLAVLVNHQPSSPRPKHRPSSHCKLAQRHRRQINPALTVALDEHQLVDLYLAGIGILLPPLSRNLDHFEDLVRSVRFDDGQMRHVRPGLVAMKHATIHAIPQFAHAI